MQPERRRGVVDVALRGEVVRAEHSVSRASVLSRLRFTDGLFRYLTHGAALGVLLLLGGVIFALLVGALPALQRVRTELPRRAELEPRHRPVRRAGTDLRHDRHVVHCHADCRSGRLVHCLLPHRAVPALAAAPDRHLDRAAGRNPEHHLRHLGALCVSRRFCSRRCSRL